MMTGGCDIEPHSLANLMALLLKGMLSATFSTGSPCTAKINFKAAITFHSCYELDETELYAFLCEIRNWKWYFLPLLLRSRTVSIEHCFFYTALSTLVYFLHLL